MAANPNVPTNPTLSISDCQRELAGYENLDFTQLRAYKEARNAGENSTDLIAAMKIEKIVSEADGKKLLVQILKQENINKRPEMKLFIDLYARRRSKGDTHKGALKVVEAKIDGQAKKDGISGNQFVDTLSAISKAAKDTVVSAGDPNKETLRDLVTSGRKNWAADFLFHTGGGSVADHVINTAMRELHWKKLAGLEKSTPIWATDNVLPFAKSASKKAA